jgi:uncharacterized protein (DUF1501 family)
MTEPEFEDIQQHLSFREQLTKSTLQRRTFLKLLGAGVAVSAMPSWMQDTAYATPALGANDGVVVIIQMGGGNDGLNTVVPISNGAYYSARKTIAIPQSSALAINQDIGLHPSLTKLKGRYDAGEVAIVQGVGWSNDDLSHFDCLTNWMSGWAPDSSNQDTGWLGRYLDGLGTNPLYGVSVGTSVPLHLIGERNYASTMSQDIHNTFFSGTSFDAPTQRLVNTLQAMGTSSTGLGEMVDFIASTQAQSIDTSQQVEGCFSPALASGTLSSQTDLVARLINANLGARVYGVSWGSFDTHQAQLSQHSSRLSELDAAIDTFYSTLNDSFKGRVTLVTFSEFGRRVQLNGSYGTDHGTASNMFVIGQNVKGGLHGSYPSLTDLDVNGNLKPSVDFHEVYATILDNWLNADSAEILGRTYTPLDLFVNSPSGGAISQPPPATIVTPLPSSPPPNTSSPNTTTSPTTPTAPSRPITYPLAYRIVTAAGAVSSYGGATSYGSTPSQQNISALAVTPDQQGYWVASNDGGLFAYGDAPFHGSAAGLKLNAPIVGMAATATGNGYWLLGRDGGIFSYGDAAFYGSTGGMKLNQPVVGMAATPTGKGYWLVASDGGIFAYGDALFYGSTGSIKLNKPIVGMAATPTGKGYRMVASDGGVFCFGDATFEGSLGSSGSSSPVIGIIT